MATAAQVLPRISRRPPQAPAAGRANVREVYFVKNIDNSRLFREVDHAQRRDCYALTALLVAAFTLLFAYAWQHCQYRDYSYQIESLRDQERGLRDWNHKLELEQAGLEDPKRIDDAARTLGLVRPDPSRVVNVDQLPDARSALGEPQLAESRFATSPGMNDAAREP